jgi:hypothetical protein
MIKITCFPRADPETNCSFPERCQKMLTFVEVLESSIIGSSLIDDGGRDPGLARSGGTKEFETSFKYLA